MDREQGAEAEEPGLALGSLSGEDRQKAGNNFQGHTLHPATDAQFSLCPNSPNFIVFLGNDLLLPVIELVFYSYLFLGHVNKLCDS